MLPDEPLLSAEERLRFDQILERVLAGLPKHIHDLLEEIPLVVEDYPSDEVLGEMDIPDPGSLCGLHTGIPLTQRSVSHSGVLGDVIHIYREGILNLAADRAGHILPRELERQIRITVLHEVGHHFGLDEAQLRQLGYG